MVKAFVCVNKDDTADARSMYLAAQQPGVKAVAEKRRPNRRRRRCIGSASREVLGILCAEVAV